MVYVDYQPIGSAASSLRATPTTAGSLCTSAKSLGVKIGKRFQARANARSKYHPSFHIECLRHILFAVHKLYLHIELLRAICSAVCCAQYTERCWPPVQP